MAAAVHNYRARVGNTNKLSKKGQNCAEQVDTTEGCPKNDLFAFKGHDTVLHIDWSYGVGP